MRAKLWVTFHAKEGPKDDLNKSKRKCPLLKVSTANNGFPIIYTIQKPPHFNCSVSILIGG